MSLFSSITGTLSALSLVLFLAAPLSAQKVRQMVFEDRAIEGKIRKPQLVLIKAEQRPVFGPIVMKAHDRELNLTEYLEGETVEVSPFKIPFRLKGMDVVKIVP